MNYLLDTCVLSELIREVPDSRVVDWVRSQAETRLHLSVLTLGELRKGVERLPSSRKRLRIGAWLDNDLLKRFAGRILPIDERGAERWGIASAKAELAGVPLPVVDGLLAATALARGMTVVTRNTKDMARTGVNLLNPWDL